MQASQATGVAEIVVLGSALGAYPGAELVGVVSATASSDAGSELPLAAAQPGQIVLVPRLLPCGECESCRRGRVAICPQRLARPRWPQPRETLPLRFLLPLAPPFCSALPDAADLFRYAALSDALLAPYSALVRTGVGPGMLCAVSGQGFRAALSAVVARAMGAAVVLVSPGLNASDRDRLLAAPFEALQVLSDEAGDASAVRSHLREIAVAAGLPPHGICVVETSGSDAGRAYALGLLERGGTALLLDRMQPLGSSETSATTRDAGAAGMPSLVMDLPAGPAHGSLALLDRAAAEGCQVLGGGSVHPDLLVELLALCERARIDLRALTRRIEPSEVEATMAQRRQGLGDRLTLPIVDYGLPSPLPSGYEAAASGLA